MQVGFIVVLSVTAGVALLVVILRAVSSVVGKRLEIEVLDRFDLQEIVGSTTRANFMGIQSEGGKQIRGKGALVLTKAQLYFLRAAPAKEFEVPIEAIRQVSLPKSFNGRSVFAPLLCVHYVVAGKQEAMAWALKDPSKWKTTIETMVENLKRSEATGPSL